MIDRTNDEATPDSLMAPFKGMGLKPIVIFTLVVHVVVILGSSIPFFVRKAFSADNAKLTREERVESAVEDATAALRKIARKHDLNPQDISDQFSGKGSRSGNAGGGAAAAVDAAPESADTSDQPPERGKSAYETNLEAQAEGPSVPTFEDEKDDIF